MAGIAASYITKPISEEESEELLLRNVEALSSNMEEEVFACAKDKDDCKFTIKTEAELSIIKRIFSGGSFEMGAEVDFTDATIIYREKHWWECGIRCGTDVTCNEVLRQMGFIN